MVSAKRPASPAEAAPQPKPHAPVIFISYPHAAPTTQIADALFQALVPAAEFWGAEVFMDADALDSSDLFDDKILVALDRCTDMVVLLSNRYWSSTYCRKELGHVVGRFERDHSVRLHFVMVETLQPEHFSFVKDRAVGRIVSSDAQIQRIGDVQFLGPFNRERQLVRLEWDDPARLSDQLALLLKRLGEVVVKPLTKPA